MPINSIAEARRDTGLCRRKSELTYKSPSKQSKSEIKEGKWLTGLRGLNCLQSTLLAKLLELLLQTSDLGVNFLSLNRLRRGWGHW